MDSFSLSLLLAGLSTIVIAITLHEMMHAVAGYALGDDTAKHEGRITLNPLAHVDVFLTVLMPLALLLLGWPPIGAAKPVPFNPARLKWGEWGMAIVALAGPLTNFALALIGSLAYRLLGADFVGADFLTIFITINIWFFVFNMLPIPPLDGSRVLYVFMPDGVRAVMDTIERFGIFVLLLIFVFIWPYLSPLLAQVSGLIDNLLL